MVVTEPTIGESEKVEHILQGLAIAVKKSRRLEDDSVQKISDTKLEKHVYYALKHYEEFDEVTNSWYLAGAKTEVQNVGVETLRNAFHNVSSINQPSIEEVVNEQEDLSVPKEIDAEAEKYAEFFTQEYDLEGAWFTFGEKFLLEFYEKEAPEPYHELYVQTQHLRNYLNQLIRALKNVVSLEAQSPSLAKYGQNAVITGPDLYSDIAEVVSKTHIELTEIENLHHTFEYYKEFTDILEDAVLALSKMQVERIDDTQIQALSQLRRKHYYQFWRLAAIQISIDTARGPRQEDLRELRRSQYEERLNGIDVEIEKLRQQCEGASLIPTIADYSSVSETDQTVGELLSMYLNDK